MSSTVIPIRHIVIGGLLRENVVTVRLLALCPMLAVSVSLTAAMTLGVLTLTVMALAGFCVSWVRVYVPSAVRLPIFLIIVATFVATADICLEASFADMHRQLGVFLPLIVTNCAVLARLEVFASRQPPLAAFVDGLMSGIGYVGGDYGLGRRAGISRQGRYCAFFSYCGLADFPHCLASRRRFYTFWLAYCFIQTLRFGKRLATGGIRRRCYKEKQIFAIITPQ